MFDFLTGSKKKVNLTPDVDYPTQEQLYHTSQLRDLARRRIAGEGTGFGDDFTSRMSSPGIAQIDANFKNRTLPTLSNEASKRGLARSSIVTDQIGQADLQRNRDVAEMVSKFQYLNEQQKKTDESNAVNLATGMNTQQAGMMADRAGQAERQVGRNVAERDYTQARQDKAGQQVMQAVGALVGGPMGASMFGGGGGATGFNPFTMSTPPAGYKLPFSASTMGGTSGVKTPLLGASNADFESWLNGILG